MRRLLVLPLLIPALLACSGCGSDSKKIPTAAVKGTVHMDGKPMPSGEIAFSITGMPAKRFEIKDGSFSGEADEGKNRVEVLAFKDGPPLTTDTEKKPTKINIIPPKWNAASTLSAEVKVGAANEFKFDITSR
ncbi:MAG: hypothetical protein U0793_24220 [Gemmataceae bacterium]